MRKAEKLPLFCYGTLRSARVMKRVTGREFTGQSAILRGYAIFRVRGTEYPGMIPRENSFVEGTLYGNIDTAALEILDRFEGDQYFRDIVKVSITGARQIDAYAYIINEQNRDILLNEPWDYAHFLKHGIDSFMHRYVEGRKEPSRF